tara:strand:+ start:50 stop:1078 length:1029 start_codon:yes stop_codon:yes gene_type:complete
MIFDYSYKPSKEDIVVSLLMNNCGDIYQGFEQELREYTQKFDITYLPMADVDKEKYQNSLFRHLLILERSDNIDDAMNQYEKLFSSYNCISIAFIYSSTDAMNKAKDSIDRLKLVYGDRVNFLRPDTYLNNSWFCSRLKTLDNAICDTIRIKYNPKKISGVTPFITHEIKKWFNSMSEFYTNYKLYHRSASDGFFAIRYGDGILITSTKTYKNPLNCERISYIHDYDEKTNTLSYSGQYLPSSDSVEAWVVFQENSDITSIVHTHASDSITRNPKFKDKIKVAKGTYGDPLIGHEINKCIRNYLNDFFILEEHGEYFTFTLEPDEISRALENILQETVALTA